MTDRRSFGASPRRPRHGPQALSANVELDGADMRAVSSAELNKHYVGALLVACGAARASALTDVCTEMQVDAAISGEVIADLYIPQVARILGERWCDDETSFAQVTIGCARLTQQLRLIERADRSPIAHDAPQILILVADEVHHTLGATVLAGHLRRQGLGVHLWVGAKPSEFGTTLAQRSYDAIFMSASRGEHLESLRLLIAAARAHKDTPPIVIGGTILETLGPDQDIVALTGADYTTNTPDEALKLCNVRLPHHAPQPKHNMSTG